MNDSKTEGNINDFFFTISVFFSTFFITYIVTILKKENTVKSLKRRLLFGTGRVGGRILSYCEEKIVISFCL